MDGLTCTNVENSFLIKEVNQKNISQKNVENELVFVGFQGMIDPPRSEVKNAIKLCKDAGIKIISNGTTNPVNHTIKDCQFISYGRD